MDNVNEHDNRDNPGDGDKTRRPGKLLAKKNEPGFRSAAGTTASGHQRALNGLDRMTRRACRFSSYRLILRFVTPR